MTFRSDEFIVNIMNKDDSNNKKSLMLDFVEFLSSPSDTDEDNVEDKTEEFIEIEKTVSTSQWQQNRATTKKNQDEKAEALAGIQRFHTHILALEKDKKSQLYNRSCNEFIEFRELQDYDNIMNLARKNELKKLNENLQRISTSIVRFKHEKDDVNKQTVYLEKLKILMEDIEKLIMDFKEEQKLVYEDLLSEEKILTTDIEACYVKVQQWSQVTGKTKSIPKHFEKNNKAANLPKEVDEFERYLQLTGGHQGGWDDIDHQIFLKLHRNIKNKADFLKTAICDIPTKAHEDIIQHMQWYVEYCALRDRKREAIRSWKLMKENEKEQFLLNADSANNDKDIQKMKREKVIAQEQQDRFEKLKEWKARKKAMEEHRENNETQIEEKIAQKAVEERERWEQKLIVAEYKRKKREEEVILESAKELKLNAEKNVLTADEKERIRERNDKILRAKRTRLLMKQEEDQQKSERLNKLKNTVVVNIERDPERLYKMTEGLRIRKETEKETVMQTPGARMMPHRAIPSWRQGLR